MTRTRSTRKRSIEGRFIIEYGGGHRTISVDEPGEHGYGRRTNCRRCRMKVPGRTDLACRNGGVIGEKAGTTTSVGDCSEKDALLMNGAVKAGIIATEPHPGSSIETPGTWHGHGRGERPRLHNTGSGMIYRNVFNPLGK